MSVCWICTICSCLNTLVSDHLTVLSTIFHSQVTFHSRCLLFFEIFFKRGMSCSFFKKSSSIHLQIPKVHFYVDHKGWSVVPVTFTNSAVSWVYFLELVMWLTCTQSSQMLHNHATPQCVYITGNKLRSNELSQSTTYISHVKPPSPNNVEYHAISTSTRRNFLKCYWLPSFSTSSGQFKRQLLSNAGLCGSRNS
jgi:hypothetical protein